MKNILKFVFTLALMAALPMAGWGTTWVTTLSVAVNGEGGTVTVSNNGTQTSTSGSLTSSATHTYTITATANDTYSFVGWFTDGSDTPFSTAAQTTRDVKVTSSSYDSRTGSLTKGYTYTKSGGTLYAKFVKHEHSFAYSIDGNTITKTCAADGCPGGVGGTATLTANGATYDGKSHKASVAKTGDVTAELTYSCGSAPTAAGTYEVTMTVDGGEAANTTLTKSFTINQASITAVTLNSTSFNYDGTDKTTSIKSVKAGSLTLNADDYDVSGDPMTQVGSLTEKKTYTVTVTGKGNYTGSASAQWTINNPTGSFDADALKPGEGCEASGNAASVNDSAKLVYANGKWYASMTIELPHKQTKSGSYVQGATFVNAANTRVEYKGSTYTGSQIQGGAVPELTAPAETSVDYKYGLIYEQRTYKYLPSVTYTMELTPEIVTAAKTEGKDALEGSVTVYALVWKDGQDYGTFGCETGLKPTTYTLTVPIDDNLKLFDEVENQVYPELPYIANIGAKKFLNLADALGAATAGQTVEVFGDAAVESGLVVPVGVTLNLGAHGNAESSYVLTGAELNNDAKVVSTVKLDLAKFSAKGDGVADNFFRVVETEDSGTYTYALELNHEHLWGNFELNGNVLTAKCTNDANTCTYEDGTVSITLNAEGKAWNSDDSAVTPTLSGTDAFVALLKDGEQHAVTIVGPMVDHPAYSTDKWLTGAYTAKCTVTIDGVDYELTQAFEITKPEGGYTSGFEALGIDGYDVRFGSLAEAASATTNGATIYYRGGNWNADKFIASPSKDITLDLGGKTLTCQEAQKSVDGFILENTGAGTVTLVNGTIDQPYGRVFGVKSAKQITVNGNFVFGSGIFAQDEADSDNNALKITSTRGKLQVVDGAYQCKFAANSGCSVEVAGGIYLKNDHCNPKEFVLPGYIVRVYSTGSGEVYQVVPHTHKHAYSAAGNVITATCNAEDHEYCGYGEETLTLTAVDREATGEPYAGASIDYSEKFPVKDAVIEYWVKDGEQLSGAPSEVGLYEARVTVGEATAVAPFEITHIHSFFYDALDAMTIGVKCTTEIGTCDYQDWKRAKLTAADTKTYDGNPYAASFELEAGFPSEDLVTVALEYWVKNGEKLDDAPSAVGDYTVKMVASEGDTTKYTLEKDFAIAPADLSIATITLTGDLDAIYDNKTKSVSISSVKLGKLMLTEDVDYTVDEASVTSGKGSGADDTIYAITINATAGNFTGSASTTWTIKALGRNDLRNTTPSAQAGGSVSGQTLTMVSGDWKFYNAESAPDGSGIAGWYAGMKISWPQTTYQYTRLEEVAINYNGTRYQGTKNEDWVAPGNFVPTTGNELSGNHKFITALTWWERLTLADVETALADGDTTITRTMSAMGMTWWHAGSLDILSYGDKEGVRETTFTIVANLENLVLPVPAGATLDVDGTAFQAVADYDGYKLQLGKGAVVYAGEDGLDNESDKMIVDKGYEVDCDVDESYIFFFTPKAIEYAITYTFEGNDGNEPTNLNPEVYTVEDEITFEPAMLDGYEFESWSLAKIEKGTIGDQTVTGTFKKSAVPPTATQDTTVTIDGCDVSVKYTLDTAAIGYDDWSVDFEVSSDVALGSDEFTLMGSNPIDGETLVAFPSFALEANTPVKLLKTFASQFEVTYAQLIAATTTYACGVVNNVKQDANVTVKIVLSKEGEDDIVVEGSTFNTMLKAKAIEPVVPGEEIDIPADKDPEEYAGEVEAQKATLLKAPVELTGGDLATYQSYFTAQVVGEMVQFVLNATGEQAVKGAVEATKPDVLAVALSADEGTFTVAEPLKGFYYSFKQGGELDNLGFNKDGDKNQIGETISFELVKPEGKGFYQTIVTPIPYVEEE